MTSPVSQSSRLTVAAIPRSAIGASYTATLRATVSRGLAASSAWVTTAPLTATAPRSPPIHPRACCAAPPGTPRIIAAARGRLRQTSGLLVGHRSASAALPHPNTPSPPLRWTRSPRLHPPAMRGISHSISAVKRPPAPRLFHHLTVRRLSGSRQNALPPPQGPNRRRGPTPAPVPEIPAPTSSSSSESICGQSKCSSRTIKRSSAPSCPPTPLLIKPRCLYERKD